MRKPRIKEKLARSQREKSPTYWGTRTGLYRGFLIKIHTNKERVEGNIKMFKENEYQPSIPNPAK